MNRSLYWPCGKILEKEKNQGANYEAMIIVQKIVLTWAKVVISGDEVKETVLRYILKVNTMGLDVIGLRHRKKWRVNAVFQAQATQY